MAENMGISDYIARFSGGGARPNLYKVIFNFPSFLAGSTIDKTKASYLCKAAALPDSTIGVANVPFMGRTVKIAGDKTFNDWNVTMLNDTDFQSRKIFEKWIASLSTHTENTGYSNPSSYYSDLEVHQLNHSGNTIYSYKFYSCFPTSVGEISLGYDQNDTVEEFPVTFAVNYWEAIACDGEEITSPLIPNEGCNNSNNTTI